MTTEERIKNISIARDNIENKKAKDKDDAIKEVQSFEQKVVKKYSNRIADLIELAYTLNINGFSIGKYDDYNMETQFESNIITHKFGFVCQGTSGLRFRSLQHIEGVGYKAGGCYGNNNFVLNEGGFVDFNDYFFKTRLGKSFEKFEQEFEKFEQEFLDYIDNL